MAARKLNKGSTGFKADQTPEGDPDYSKRKPEHKLPSDFDTEADFLSDMRKAFYNDICYDRLNRDAAIEDLRFLVGWQWDDLVRQRREAARKPVLTINRLPAFLAQVTGSRRLNETTIKVLPDNGGTQAVARIREGIMRSIVKLAHGDRAFDKAYEQSVSCGIGNFQVEMNWCRDDVWNQELTISKIDDPLAVVWDRMLSDGTGADAGHCFVVDIMTKADFHKRWPWAVASDVVVDQVLRGDLRMNGWIAVDDVRVVSYWRMRSRPRMLALFKDGTTHDITDDLKGEDTKLQTLAQIEQRGDGTPIMRRVDKKYAQMYLCSGLDILEGPYDLEIPRVPVFRVPGWEINITEWKHRWGLLRFMKDPQRLHNYWRSAVAEKLMQTPRGVWMAADTAVAGREQQWRNSHLSDDPLLVYNAEAGQVPQRIAPAQLEQALISEAEMTNQDLKDVSNIHEANLGMPSNEVSGAAIVARQRVSDTGTVIYQDNLTAAIEECGGVINLLMPVCYDTPRIVKILGEDGREDMQQINKEGDAKSVDITEGKYSITVKTGPTTATKRIEAADSMMTFINAAPMVAGYTMDLVAAAMDWPQHEEFARRIRMTLPPGMIDQKDMTPELQARQQQQQQQGAQQAQMQFHLALAKYLNMQSQTQLNSARAENFETQSQLAPAKANTDATNSASQAADRELRGSLEAIKVAETPAGK